MMDSRLVLTEAIHTQLREHLFPGDGKEAAAILICSRYQGKRLKLLAKELIKVPYEACKSRAPDAITWPGRYLEDAIDVALPETMSIILVHSHPGGFLAFSDVDDESDIQTMESLFQGVETIHGSAIMVSTGEMRARLYCEGADCIPVELVTVAGDDIHYWWNGSSTLEDAVMAFTSDMTHVLNRLTVAVIGASGTGSISIEQVTRLGFGTVIMVDHDHVELKNLNRILNSTLKDAAEKKSKVAMLAEAIEAIRGPNVAQPLHSSIRSREAVLTVADADVIFCCVDSHQARMVTDLIASAFLIPLFDVGVKIPTHVNTDGERVITDVTGRIDYVKPGGSTLGDRKVYTAKLLAEENLLNKDRELYEKQLAEGYFVGVQDEAPSVITLNMRAASACVSEFIARAFPFRESPNGQFAQTIFSLAGSEEYTTEERKFSASPNLKLAVGSKEPLLGIPDLGAL